QAAPPRFRSARWRALVVPNGAGRKVCRPGRARRRPAGRATSLDGRRRVQFSCGGVGGPLLSPSPREPKTLTAFFRRPGLVGGAARAVGPRPARGQEAVRLEERFPVGYQYYVQTRVQLSGTLALPAEKGKPAQKPLAVSGESSIDYDERVLALEKDGRVAKTVRRVRRIGFDREMAGTPQKTTLRPSVRRVVMLRLNNTEVPFSPDGPLTWGEIDVLRTDVFTPALTGLLPPGAVRAGERWRA